MFCGAALHAVPDKAEKKEEQIGGPFKENK